MLRKKNGKIKDGQEKVYIIVFIVNMIISAVFVNSFFGLYDKLINHKRIFTGFEYVVIQLPFMLQLILPIISGICGVLFYNYKNTIYKLEIIRAKSPSRLLMKRMNLYSAKMAWAIFLGILFLTFLAYFILPRVSNINAYFLSREIPLSFFKNHVILHSIFTIFVKTFCSTYLMCMVACAFALLLEKKYLSFLIPVIYYLSLSLFLDMIPRFEIFGIAYADFFFYFQPSYLTAADYKNSVLFIGVLGAMLIYISVISLIVKSYKYKMEY